MISAFQRYALITFVFISLMSWSSPSSAQYVDDTALCTNIVDDRCIGLIPSGADIPIQSIPVVNGHRTIFLWASVSASKSRALGLYILRDGACYKNEIKISDKKLRSEPSFLRTMRAYVSSGRLISDVMEALSLKNSDVKLGADAGAGPAKVDASINLVVVPEANEYHVHHFRYVTCPGTFVARVIDSDGQPFPGSNEIKTVTFY